MSISLEARPSKLFEIHGHSKYNFFPVEGVQETPTQIVAQTKVLQYDGVAMSGHDTLNGVKEAMEEGERQGVLVIPGVEITCWEGGIRKPRFPHILMLGATPRLIAEKSGGRMNRFQSVESTLHWAKRLGLVVVAAHPTEEVTGRALNFDEIYKYRDLFDAVETTTLLHQKPDNTRLDKLARLSGLAKIGATDFHMAEQRGYIGTKIYGDIQTYQDALDAIRNGECEPVVRGTIPEGIAGRKSRNPIIDLLLHRHE